MVVAFRNPCLGVCFFLVHLATLASSVRDSSSSTPLEKVVSLLKKLSVQLTEEGKVEAAQYDKYACFCKEQADEKLYAVETSEKKIALMKAEIDEMSKEITALNGEISELTKKIGDLEKDIKAATGKREGEVKVYQGHSKDIIDAISACERAIEAMKNSKGNIDGKVDLAQMSKSSPLFAAALISSGVKQAPPSYEYQSNDIIAVLENLLIKFKANKVDLDTSEFNARSAFEMKEQAMQNQKKFAEQEKSEKETQVESLEESKAETTEDKDEETKAKDADNDFIKVLTTDCETKAKDWDQRSSTRADEITAITTALTDLEEKAVGNYKVNKKLVDMQMKPQVKSASSPEPSFLQIRRSPGKTSLLARATNANRIAATQRVLDLC
jgi:peptidoglycan hydrolase CwlO-like protein